MLRRRTVKRSHLAGDQPSVRDHQLPTRANDRGLSNFLFGENEVRHYSMRVARSAGAMGDLVPADRHVFLSRRTPQRGKASLTTGPPSRSRVVYGR